MIFMRILPGMLKEILKHVPTVLFDVVQWSELASELPKLSRKIIKKEGYAELFSRQMGYLPQASVALKSDILPNIEKEIPLWAAEKILTLYFAQLFSPHGIFLDLRPNHFELGQSELFWSPSPLWVKFDEKFKRGLLDIYEGFYTQNDELYHQGLMKSELMDESWPREDREKLAHLFKAQFGNSISDKIQFTLEGFKNSMMEIADFLLVKKVTMSKDFLYLGIYLVTLYSMLEKCDEGIAVREIYLSAKALTA